MVKGGVPKWLRERSAKPLFTGSNPVAASSFLFKPLKRQDLGRPLLRVVRRPSIPGRVPEKAYSHSYGLGDGSILVLRHEIFDDWTRIRNEWILIKGNKATTHRFHHRVYSGQELRELLESVGFKDVRLYGHLDGDEYGFESDRLIVVGHKT